MGTVINIDGILELLPHRYPFLMVDRVEIIEHGKKATGYKNVTMNEPYFQGHFPDNPIMPGVMMLEAMAQVGGVLVFDTVENPKNKLILFAAMDSIKFRNPVRPGDVFRMEIEVIKFSGKIGKIQSKGYVGDKLAVEAIQTCVVVEKDDK